MREEIENDACGHSHFLAEQKCFIEVIQAVLVRNNDQFVHSTLFQEGANVLRCDNRNQLQPPVQMCFNSVSEVGGGWTASHNCNMTNVKCTVFFQFQEKDPV